MIRLRANAELKQTFERLIGAAKVPVKWNGIFVVVDNYMILQGEVRSLFFHFDTKKVTSNIIEIPEQEEGPGRRRESACTKRDQYDSLCLWKMGDDRRRPCGQG